MFYDIVRWVVLTEFLFVYIVLGIIYYRMYKAGGVPLNQSRFLAVSWPITMPLIACAKLYLWVRGRI